MSITLLKKLKQFFLPAVCLALSAQFSQLESREYKSPILLKNAAPVEVTANLQEQYNEAEYAIQAGDLAHARALFLDILEKLKADSIDAHSHYSVAIRLALVCHELKDYTLEHSILSDMMNFELSNDHFYQVCILQAKIYTIHKQHFEAYKILINLRERIHFMEWLVGDQDLYNQIHQYLNQENQQMLVEAERMFNAGSYNEALTLYQEVHLAARSGYYPDAISTDHGKNMIIPQIVYRISQSFYMEQEFDLAIRALEETPETLTPSAFSPASRAQETFALNRVYLLGLCYREVGQYSQAITQLHTYLRISKDLGLKEHDEVYWQLGYTAFLGGDYEGARHYLSGLENSYVSSDLRGRATLYIAHIDLLKGETDEAEKRLNAAEKILAKTPLLFEVHYLRGKLAFRNQRFNDAITHFSNSLPARNQSRAKWYRDALYYLGWSHLKFTQEPRESSEELLAHIDLAETSFQTLIDNSLLNDSLKDYAYLALAQVKLQRGGDDMQEQIDKIINQEGALISLDSKVQGLLISAEAASSYTQKELLYDTVIQEKYLSSRYYPEAWFLKAFNDYETAILVDKEEKEDKKPYLEKAMSAFETAFVLLDKTDKKRAVSCLKYQAEISQHLHFNEEALSFTQSYLEYSKKNHLKVKNIHDMYFLQGVIAYHVFERTEDETKLELAERSLLTVINGADSKDPKREQAMSFLGTTYFQQGKHIQAQDLFVKLAKEYPQSQKAGEALFWASESAEWLNQDLELVQSYRRRCFESHASSSYADEAYFSYFPYSDYLQGTTEAIDHLHAMKHLFPSSPYLISTHYLIGLDYKKDKKNKTGDILRRKDLNAAVEAFGEVHNAFEECYASNQLGDNNLDYFANAYYRASHEKALCLLAIASEATDSKKSLIHNEVKNTLLSIIHDLENGSHPLASQLTSGMHYSLILEESEFTLAQTHINLGELDEAESVLNSILDHYASRQEVRGYHLSRAWYELGKIAMHRKNYQKALALFSDSEDTGKGSGLSGEQKLDLWIQLALSHKELKDNNTAMKILSKVINDNTASPLRLKAMYLRAEIYEADGRHELAMKQLEVTSKKAGEWALKAKDKLEQNYGFR
jgi:TolA-binding protein